MKKKHLIFLPEALETSKIQKLFQDKINLVPAC